MIEIRQTLELPKDVQAYTLDGKVILKASGRLGLYALNRTVEVVQIAAQELRDALGD